MENDPKDDKITNQDDSVTNKDGDNDLEKGEQPADQSKKDDPRVPTVTPDNENGDPGPPTEEKEVDPSNTDAGPAGENL